LIDHRKAPETALIYKDQYGPLSTYMGQWVTYWISESRE
jgi:hypothetical protein